jgi:hypothetical protein
MPELPLAALGWNEWLVILALAISAGSILLALRADWRAGRAEERAKRAERRDEERRSARARRGRGVAASQAEDHSSRLRRRTGRPPPLLVHDSQSRAASASERG